MTGAAAPPLYCSSLRTAPLASPLLQPAATPHGRRRPSAAAPHGRRSDASPLLQPTVPHGRGLPSAAGCSSSPQRFSSSFAAPRIQDLQGRIVRVSYAHDRGSRAGGYRGGGYGGQGAYGNGGDGGYSDGGRGYGSGSGGGYSNFSNYGGYNTSGGYNSVGGRGGYGVSEGGHGYGSGTGYAGDSGGYYTAPGNYSGDNFRHGGAAPGAYEGGNYGGSSNNSYTSNAPSDESAGKLDDLLSDLNVGDGQGDGESKDEGVGLVDEDLKGDDQEELIQDDLKDADVADDYANKTS